MIWEITSQTLCGRSFHTLDAGTIKIEKSSHASDNHFTLKAWPERITFLVVQPNTPSPANLAVGHPTAPLWVRFRSFAMNDSPRQAKQSCLSFERLPVAPRTAPFLHSTFPRKPPESDGNPLCHTATAVFLPGGLESWNNLEQNNI